MSTTTKRRPVTTAEPLTTEASTPAPAEAPSSPPAAAMDVPITPPAEPSPKPPFTLLRLTQERSEDGGPAVCLRLRSNVPWLAPAEDPEAEALGRRLREVVTAGAAEAPAYVVYCSAVAQVVSGIESLRVLRDEHAELTRQHAELLAAVGPGAADLVRISELSKSLADVGSRLAAATAGLAELQRKAAGLRRGAEGAVLTLSLQHRRTVLEEAERRLGQLAQEVAARIGPEAESWVRLKRTMASFGNRADQALQGLVPEIPEVPQ
jgi:hypothetical protein